MNEKKTQFTITDKELILVITHAHLDHMHHMDEFETVYMCHDELTMAPDVLRLVTGGYGVFLQIRGATSLETYYESLLSMMNWLMEKRGRMTFWGGHSHQMFESSLILNYNPLSMGLLADLIDLVDGVIKGAIVGRPSNASGVNSMDPALYASFGRAELQYNPKTIYGVSGSPLVKKNKQ